ncbi:MAG: hypothetical protein AB7F40_04940 [Victivallaceae bacterium]
MQRVHKKQEPARSGQRQGSWLSSLLPCLAAVLVATGTLYFCAEFERHAIAEHERATDAARMTRANTGQLAERPAAMNDEYNRIEESRAEGESTCRRALQPWRASVALFFDSDFDVFIPGIIRQVEKPPASGRQLRSLFTQELPKRAGPALGDGISAACLS